MVDIVKYLSKLRAVDSVEFTDLEALAALDALGRVDRVRLLALAGNGVDGADAGAGRTADALRRIDAVAQQVLALARTAFLIVDVLYILVYKVAQAGLDGV